MPIDFNYERNLRKKYNYKHIAGLDEVGRGPLAGPVTAGAFVFFKNFPQASDLCGKLRDSKLLSAKQRNELYEVFCEWKKRGLCDFATYSAMPVSIDKKQIHHASVLAMRGAIKKLSKKPDLAVIDRFPYKGKILHSPNYKAIYKADNLVPSVAAASIVAKVRRDKTMVNYHKKYPQYRFDLHKGYGTKLHRAMIKKHGACPLHRKSFKLI